MTGMLAGGGGNDRIRAIAGAGFHADAIWQALPAAALNPDDGRRFSKET
jgi:hypothetical protein